MFGCSLFTVLTALLTCFVDLDGDLNGWFSMSPFQRASTVNILSQW